MAKTLSDWMAEHGIPGITGIDTRKLTKKLREHGSMLGKIFLGEVPPQKAEFCDLYKLNLVSEVSNQVIIFFS